MSFLIANLCAQTQACKHHPQVYHLRSNQLLPTDFSGALKGLIFSPTKLSLPQTTNSISYEKLSQRLKMLGQQVFCDTGPGSFCSQGLSSYL